MQSNLNHGADVALFIDWENFKISLAVGNRTPNVSALKEEVSNHGRVVIAKAYADWVTRAPELRGASQFLNDPPSLYAAGIEPVFVPTRAPSPNATNANGMRTGRIKNSVDVKMTADCIEIAHSYPQHWHLRAGFRGLGLYPRGERPPNHGQTRDRRRHLLEHITPAG